MKPERAPNDSIQAITDYKWRYSVRPGKDNTRNRKFSFRKMISSIHAFRGGTLNREIMDGVAFGFNVTGLVTLGFGHFLVFSHKFFKLDNFCSV